MTDLKPRILAAALPAVIFDGWTEGAIARAAESAGISAFDVKRTFPDGVIELIDYFFVQADQQMLETLERDYKLAEMKIRERIATAVLTRLRQQAPHREAIRRALGVYAMPWHAASALKRLYATVDAIWRAAGDTSTDYNFYTKRLLLSKVYSTTITVWLDDATEDLSTTEAFLRRRIENVMQIEKFKAKAKEKLGALDQWLPSFVRKKA